MRKFIKELSNQVYKIGFNDENSFKIFERKLGDFYYGRRDTWQEAKWTKKEFQVSFSSSTPSIDSDMRNTISRNNVESLPRNIATVSNSEVETKTRETISRYTRRSPRLRHSCKLLFGNAAISAAQQLNIFNQSAIGTIKPKGIRESVLNVSKNTNSGFPLYTRKNSPNAQKDAEIWLNQLYQNPTIYKIYKNPLLEVPQVIFHRFQIKLSEDLDTINFAIRVVWGLSYRIVALEDIFFHDIINRVKASNFGSIYPVSSTGMNNVMISNKLVGRLRKCVGTMDGSSLYSMDYSKYDQSIPNFAIDYFFKICESQLDLTEKDRVIFNLLRTYTKFSPFVYNKEFFLQSIGISSGSLITNLFDTWWNLTLWICAKIVSSDYNDELDECLYGDANILDFRFDKFIRLTTFNSIALCGDDVLIYTDTRHVFAHKILCNSLGVDIKIFMRIDDPNEDTFFLGRYWDKFNRPIQSEQYMSSHIIVRERFYKKEDLDFDISEKLSLFRVLSICCPLANGLDYLEKTFYDWEPYKEFKRTKEGFYYLKEWPNENYEFIDYLKFTNWKVL